MPATNELLQEGRYRIGQRSTGDDTIFEAYDTVRNTHVVVREIPVKLNKVATVSQRESLKLAFTNQAKALTEIDHESLPHVHDYFSEIDRQYLVMEPVGGESLDSLIARSGKPFSVSQVIDWADQLLDALHCLHSHRPSIIHRNIRPQNINLAPSGKLKLLGVGVESGAESADADDSSSLRYSPIEQIWPGLDPASQKAITNHYDDRSERILKEPMDARSDIYSLGATLYFLVTGHEPVDALERSIDILEGKLDPLREPTKVDQNIPAEISDVLMKALEIKRENRYDSALIMRQVLQDVIARLTGDSVSTVESASPPSGASVAPHPSGDSNARSVEAERELKLRAEEDQRRVEAEREQKLREEAEQRRVEAEREQKLKAEEERLRAEEEQRLRAEEEQRKLAEEQARAERIRQEEEEAAARAQLETSEKATPEENLLEIPAGAEVVAYRDTTADIDEAELAAVLEELEAAESGRGRDRKSHVMSDAAGDNVQVFEGSLDSAPQHAAAAKADDEEIFTIPERSGFSLPLPAIAGGIGLIVVIAVAAWFAMSGSAISEAPVPVQTLQVAQPSSEPSPVEEPIVSTQSEAEAPITADPSAEQPAATTKAAANPAKSKKADAPKPEKKKAVTVDDLINDN